MLCGMSVFAQSRKITGTVVDKDGQPLMGVQVKSETGDVAVTTDLDGRFEITVPEGSKLTFSILGTKSKTKEAADGMTVVMGISEKNEVKKGFQGMFDLNSNFTSSHGGIGADLILGGRINPYYHIGAGLGVHSLIGKDTYEIHDTVKTYRDNNVFATLYLNNTVYIPTGSKVTPMFDCGLGCCIGWLGISQPYKETIIGLYAKAGLGFEAGMFRMSAGYELIGTHTGYVRIGIKF